MMLDQDEVIRFMAAEYVHYAEAHNILQFSDARTDHNEMKERR